MKKIFITCAFFAFSFGAMAQQDSQENLDQLQQQPPRETQIEMERAAARDAKKTDAEKKQAEAEDQKVRDEEARKREAVQKEDELQQIEEAKKNAKSKK